MTNDNAVPRAVAAAVRARGSGRNAAGGTADTDRPSSLPMAGRSISIGRSFPDDLIGSRRLRIAAPKSKIPGRERIRRHGQLLTGRGSRQQLCRRRVQHEHPRAVRRADFGPLKGSGVPLERYGLTGYGASCSATRVTRAAPGPAITQARFDVIVGRTAYEVIQMQSLPLSLVRGRYRSVTIQRTEGGWMLREDSGWVGGKPRAVRCIPKSDDVARRQLYANSLPPRGTGRAR